jgi:hypothetical protein
METFVSGSDRPEETYTALAELVGRRASPLAKRVASIRFEHDGE